MPMHIVGVLVIVVSHTAHDKRELLRLLNLKSVADLSVRLVISTTRLWTLSGLTEI